MNSNLVWRTIKTAPVGYLTEISPLFEELEKKNPGCFPNLRSGTEIVIASDYSGEHQGSDFYGLSFVLLDWNASVQWSVDCQKVRSNFLPNNREMAYKKFKNKNAEGGRKAALAPFLEAANQIPGVAFTFLIDKRINSVIEGDGVNELRNLIPALANWAPSAIEKLYRVQTFIAFLLAGLARSEQPIYWITDEDEIVATTSHLAIAIDLLPRFSKTHFGHELNLADVGTVKSLESNAPTGLAMDLAAIPDLVGGTLVDSWNARCKLTVPTTRIQMEKIPEKARTILDWFAQDNHRLKKLAAVIELSGDSNAPLFFRWLKF